MSSPEARLSAANRSDWWVEKRGLVLIALAIAWFYFWTATSANQHPDFKVRDLEYYNLLVDGFLDGHTSLKYAGDPGIARLANPYDPAQNAPYRVMDMSYFKGKYYIYFGPTPVLLLLLPWKLLLGFHLPTHLGAVFFCAGGYGLSLLVLLRLRRRYFPDIGAAAVWLAAAVLGLANMAPVLLRRAAVYELAIAAGYAFIMLVFWAVARALHSRPGRTGWLAVASAAYGFAILARPTCIYGAVIFAPLLACWYWRDRVLARNWGRGLLAAAIPVGVIFTGMLAYNYVRFGNPLEFGQIYQLTGRNMGEVKAFSWSYLPFNSWLYLLMPAQLSIYFPFFLNALPPPMPAGYDGLDDLYGLLPNLPVVLGVLGLFFLGWNRAREEARDLRLYAGLLALWLAGVLAVFLFFSGATIRYYLDFMPAWLLLGCVGAWAGWRRLRGRFWLGLAARGAFTALALFSLAFAVMVSFQHGAMLRTFNPAAFTAIARAANYPSFLAGRLTGVRYGPVRIELKFPRGRRGQFEPLMVSGAFPATDYLWVLYTDDQHVQIGYEHTNHGGTSTQPIRVDYAASHTLEVDAGFLYPPEAHPYFGGRREESALRTHRLEVVLDGVPYLDTMTEFYDPISRDFSFGRNRVSDTFGRRFTGTVERIEQRPARTSLDVTPQAGPVELALVFPRDRIGTREPLIVTGETGRGDLFYVEYLDETHVRFALDHWSVGVVQSEPVTIVPGYIQILQVSLGSLYPGADSPMQHRLAVRLNGTTVLDKETAFHPARLESQTFGLNLIGGSTCGPNFNGKIASIKRGFPW